MRAATTLTTEKRLRAMMALAMAVESIECSTEVKSPARNERHGSGPHTSLLGSSFMLENP